MQAPPSAYPSFTKAPAIKAFYSRVTHEPYVAGLHFIYHIKNTASARSYLTSRGCAVFWRSAIYRIYQLKIPVQLYPMRCQLLY
jgi:hypothetical protein